MSDPLPNEVRAPASSTPREVALASVGILVFLTVLKHVGPLIPVLGDHVGTLAAAAQLYLPLWLADRVPGLDRDDLGLPLEGLGWAEARKLARDAGLGLRLLALTVVPFAVAHHLWQTQVGHHSFVPRAPEGIGEFTLVQVLVVALPEELFFRGYLQARMALLWPGTWRAIVAASAVFALAHFVGEYNPVRLGPFFPALVFGWLRVRTGGLAASIVYHAGCNVLAEALWASYA